MTALLRKYIYIYMHANILPNLKEMTNSINNSFNEHLQSLEFINSNVTIEPNNTIFFAQSSIH